MTPKQERFVDEYLIDLNATQAAIRAGYSVRTADRIGPELLGKTCVKEAIELRKAGLSLKAEISAEEVIKELKHLGFSDIGDVLNFQGDKLCLKAPNEIPESVRRAVSSIKVKRHVEGQGEDARVVEVIEFKLCDKIAALRELALHLPGFRAPTQISATIGDIDAAIARELARVAGESKGAIPGETPSDS